MAHLRTASPTDIPGIARVAQDVWEQDILFHVCKAHIKDDACSLWVATEDHEIAGFASAFPTVAGDGRRRWEIDLVAVRRASQSQGLGTNLIRRITATGQAHRTSLARALIGVENAASQRAFEHAGFTTDCAVHKLLLWPPEIEDAPRPYSGPVTLLPVDTLTYRGLWIEGLTGVPADEQRRAVTAARSLVAQQSRLNAGAVIAADEAHHLAPDLRLQATAQGEYHWFIRPVRKP